MFTILTFAAAATQSFIGVAPPPPPPPPGLRIVRNPDAARFYPARERKAARGGVADVDLGLRQDGIVTRCRVAASSGSAALDAAACKLARALRFEPASHLGGPQTAQWGGLEYGCCTRVRVEWQDGGARVRAMSAPRSLRILNLPQIMTSADYPAVAFASKAGGLVVIELAASSTGIVTGCTVVQSSGTAVLDRTSCALATTRARLLPATNMFAEPIASSTKMRMRWNIEE